MTNSNRVSNRLINEKSPYLLQHAYNPVDWYPWSDEALDKAKEEDKPIFLSIGYSTCHWCHVMEKESFEDTEVADILNRSFVCIKVDREERPDVDHIYMTICQALTGHGGWPLTIIMTPDQKPFFAGTYFPKTTTRGMIGIIELLEKVGDNWNENRDSLISTANTIIQEIKPHLTFESGQGEINKGIIDKAYDELKATFDHKYGGFGSSPKFPIPHNLYFLLRHWKLKGKNEALTMVEKTLDGMYKGGIFDHIGYGFSRYSTDKRWLVPHFEKMLYDNALLAIGYLEFYQIVGKGEYAKIAEKVFTYILRDMTHPEGGFYSAEDADSEGVEGKYYVWTPTEIEDILGKDEGKLLCDYYDITLKGNFESESIPNLISSREHLLENEDQIGPIRLRLLKAREKRVHPHKDDKILTAWNGLMIGALAIGARVLGNKTYLESAERALSFILTHLKNSDDRLLARYRDGDSAHLAYLNDYAYLVWGLIELYHTTFNPKYLAMALDMNREMINLFLDEEEGGLFLYAKDSEALIARPKEIYDGAMPSGNSVAIYNMLRLAKLTGDYELDELAYNQLNTFAEAVEQAPSGHSYFLMAAIFALYPTQEVVIVGHRGQEDTEKMIDILHNSFSPQSINIFKDKVDNKVIQGLVPYLKDQVSIDNKATAYICENYACKSPIIGLDDFQKAIE